MPTPTRFHGDDCELVWAHYGLDMHERHEARYALLLDPRSGMACYRELADEILSGRAR